MKTRTKFFLSSFFAIALSACDPCASLVCDNGTCSNGACNCDTGYVLDNKNCIGVNMEYVGTGTANATQLWVDNMGDTTNPANATLTLSASTTDPYVFTLLRFNNIIKNDLVFNVSTNSNGLLTPKLINTIAGSTYNISGEKVGSQVTLVISEPNGTTYTLKYGA